jgi:hypothetical protein
MTDFVISCVEPSSSAAPMLVKVGWTNDSFFRTVIREVTLFKIILSHIRIILEDLASIPTPRSLIVSSYHLYRYEQHCYLSIAHVLVPDITALKMANHIEHRTYWRLRVHNITTCHKSKAWALMLPWIAAQSSVNLLAEFLDLIQVYLHESDGFQSFTLFLLRVTLLILHTGPYFLSGLKLRLGYWRGHEPLFRTAFTNNLEILLIVSENEP